MSKTLVIAEKPSVGRDLTKALPGAFAKHEGYLESDAHVVTWAVGHLVQLGDRLAFQFGDVHSGTPWRLGTEPVGRSSATPGARIPWHYM